MKKRRILVILSLASVTSFGQVKTVIKDLQVPNSFQLSLNKVVAISKDTTYPNKRDNYLITEKAAKDYADKARYGLIYNFNKSKYLITKNGAVVDSVPLPYVRIDTTDFLLRGDSMLALKNPGGGGGGSALFPTIGTGTATGNVTGQLGTNNFNLLASDGSKFSFLPADKTIQLSVGPLAGGFGDTYIRLRGNDANDGNNSIAFVVDGNGSNKSLILSKDYGLGINAKAVFTQEFLLNDGSEGTAGYVLTSDVLGRGQWALPQLPLLPTFGTGTATGDVTGNLNSNTLNISNGKVSFSSNDYKVATFTGVESPFDIWTADETLSAGYAGAEGSIGNGGGTLQVKYGTSNGEWGKVVHEDNVGNTQLTGDVEITDYTKGIILKTSDGTRARITLVKDSLGNLSLQISNPL